jgi:hypothetical protein
MSVQRLRYDLSDCDPSVWQAIFLNEEMIDCHKHLIHQVEIVNSLRVDCGQRRAGEIERATIALSTIGALNHCAV